jgi:DNA-binding transcriptional LysR family regulator
MDDRAMIINGDDPTIHQLRLVLMLAEELHFGRAANRLYLTQPALSQQIRSVEQRWGVRLFTRTSRKVELTAQGEALLPLVRNVVDAADELRLAVTPASGPRRLRLGVCESFAALEATRKVLARIASDHPGLGPDIRVVDMVEQLTVLAEGQIDAAFIYLPVPDGLYFQPLTTEPRLVCVSSSDPLARHSSLRLADLAESPVVSVTTSLFQASRDYWAVDPRPEGTPVRYTAHQVTRFESLLSMVSFGGAIAFVPSVAAELYPRPDLRYIPVLDLSPCTFGLAWPTSDTRSHIVALQDVCHRLSQEGLAAGTMQTPTRQLHCV